MENNKKSSHILKKFLRKLGIFVLVAVGIVFSIASAYVSSWAVIIIGYGVVEYNTPDEMIYMVNSDGITCTVTGAKDTSDLILNIPKEIDGYTVTQILPNAFQEYENLMIVWIPDSIESIGANAFKNCRRLQWVSGIEKCSSLKEIDKFTFAYCDSLILITLPDSIEVIDQFAFNECTLLINMDLPEKLHTIGVGAFATCTSLRQINIPASVKNIGEIAFGECVNSKKITVDESNPYWCSIDGVLYSKDACTLHSYPSGKNDKHYVVPEGVTTISNFALALNESIEILEIPSSVVEFGKCIVAYSGSLGDQLHTINYHGTIDMWNSIKKSIYWDGDSPDFTIYCTDGTIDKDGTVTYK